MANLQVIRGNKASIPALLPGEPGFCTDTEELFIGGANGNVLVNANMTLLWENAAPTSMFGGQTITKDLSGYTHVMIVAIQKRDLNVVESPVVCKVGDSFSINIAMLVNISRDGSVDETGVTFGAAKRKPTYSTTDDRVAANELVIPYRIYGIKGVQ